MSDIKRSLSRQFVPLVLVGAATMLHPGPAAADVSSTTQTAAVVADAVKEIRDDLAPLIAAAQQRFQVPGLSLALVQGGTTLWAEGFGYADIEERIRATPSTVYRAGSLAKPLTATAVMQLAQSGQIDIDQPLNAYLPGFSIRSRFDTTAAPITVRSVLSHHAGLPTDLTKGMWTRSPFTGVVERLDEEYTAFPPELVFSYSNLGYTLLGHMVEVVSGTPYTHYMAEHLFRPLGMHRSGMGEPPGSGVTVARGYRDGKRFDLLPVRDLPAHGLYTSAEDMGRFMKAMLAGGSLGGDRLLDRATVEQMWEPQNLDVPLDLDIVNGLGWFLEHESIPGGGTVVRHGGTTLVFGSEMILLPQHGLGVVVLANADGSRSIVSKLAEAILSRVLATSADPPSADLFLAELEKQSPQPGPADIAGRYATDFGLISIQAKDPKLCACLIDETFDLIPYPNGWFGLDDDARGLLPQSMHPLAAMTFRTERIDGREVVVARHGDKQVLIGEKVPDAPIPEVWLQRVGHYQLLNPDPGFPLTEPRLKVQDGQLCMSYRLPKLSGARVQVPLRPISDTEAIILGLGRTRGETLRAFTLNGEERLRYSGYVGRKTDDPE
jgi:CubicO group peptidase (beta-lactamase class C family)